MSGQKGKKVLLFSVGEERYALEIDLVESILHSPKFFPIPKQPEFFRGFFEYEAECVALIDLHYLLGIPKTNSSVSHHTLILRYLNFRLAVQADSVLGAREFEQKPVKPDPALHEAESIEVEGKPYLLLNLDSLLEGNLSVSGSR